MLAYECIYYMPNFDRYNFCIGFIFIENNCGSRHACNCLNESKIKKEVIINFEIMFNFKTIIVRILGWFYKFDYFEL